jgi:hypothetical protein
MSYNLSIIADNSTTMLGFTQGVNTVLMQDMMGVILLVGLTLVCLLAFMFSTNDAKKSVAASAFIAFLLSIFIRAMGLMNNKFMLMSMVIAAVAIAFTFRSE